MILNEITGGVYFHKGEYKKAKRFNPDYLKEGTSVYEVLRVIQGKPLFLKDHLERFSQSLAKTDIISKFDQYDFWEVIANLVEKNNLSDGNIKIVCNMNKKAQMFAYFIPHRYPTDENYAEGVKMASSLMERTDPHVKAVNLTMREKTEALMAKKDIYDVLLVDHNGNITEGSKSNIFFIKGDEVYTSPEKVVLPGITRKYVFSICHENNIKLIEDDLPYDDISGFESAFITGTSPKVLPVNMIDDIPYNVRHEVLIKLIDRYDKLIRNFIDH